MILLNTETDKTARQNAMECERNRTVNPKSGSDSSREGSRGESRKRPENGQKRRDGLPRYKLEGG